MQLDRLPKENSLEGLLLLRSAWRDHDVAMLLAGRYKRVCKAAFLMQLLLGWAAVALSTFTTGGGGGGGVEQGRMLLLTGCEAANGSAGGHARTVGSDGDSASAASDATLAKAITIIHVLLKALDQSM